MDSAFYNHEVIGAIRRAGARFSVTARMGPTVRAAIASIENEAWTAIHYPNSFVDSDTGDLVSDAEVAEVPLFTAFTSRRKHEQVTARLIVRRVKRLNPDTSRGKVAEGQEELFTTWRYHAVFTDSPEAMLDAEATHRAHAIVEQVIADLKAGPLAHLPCGVFTANAAWLALAAIAFNLLRAAGALAATQPGDGLAVATTSTLRARLITVPARLARSARRLTLPAPTPPMALASGVDPARRRHARSHRRLSGSRLSAHRPIKPRAGINVEDPESPGDHSRPSPKNKIKTIERDQSGSWTVDSG